PADLVAAWLSWHQWLGLGLAFHSRSVHCVCRCRNIAQRTISLQWGTRIRCYSFAVRDDGSRTRQHRSVDLSVSWISCVGLQGSKIQASFRGIFGCFGGRFIEALPSLLC